MYDLICIKYVDLFLLYNEGDGGRKWWGVPYVYSTYTLQFSSHMTLIAKGGPAYTY